MIHTYTVIGMTCSGCEATVQKDLSKVENVTEVLVSKEKKEAIITMTQHIKLATLQEALGGKESTYQISVTNATNVAETKAKSCCSTENKIHKHNEIRTQLPLRGLGGFYCPMHCEGDKTYDKAGDCPVCGMDLVKEPTSNQVTHYTCPMHPEIVEEEPGSCPICGMDLVPMEPSD
jgi:copper chaperone CopZ